MRAAIYCRISMDRKCDDGKREGLGVARQLEDCRALADQLGWSVVEVYTDNDVSATSSKPRPAYQRMLADVAAGSVDAIIAWHADRLYRKATDLGELVDVCKQHGTHIATARAGNIDLTTPTGRLVAGLLAQVATYEGEAKSDRWRRSVRQKREAGEPPKGSRRLFGYARRHGADCPGDTCVGCTGYQDNQIIEEEARLVRELAESLIEGVPIRALAARLNDAGVRTTLGNQWSRQTLVGLLSNPRLAGLSHIRGDVLGQGTWEPIISAETHEQILSALNMRRTTMAPPRAPRISLLLGLIECSECGQSMRGGRRSRRGAEVRGQRIYKCLTAPGEKGCGGTSILAEPVEEMVEAYAKVRLGDPWVRSDLEQMAATTGDKTAEIVALEGRLGELEAQLAEPEIPLDAIRRAMDRTRERIESLRASIVPGPATLPDTDRWPEDLARRARLVWLVVGRVRIEPQTRGGNVFDPERVKIDRRQS